MKPNIFCAASVRRLSLPQVTLCAVTSVNVAATVRAMEVCLEQIDFAACKLFTDALDAPRHPRMEMVLIDRLNSAAAYSNFLLTKMVDYIETPYCLVVQWDGHVLDAGRWRPEFLNYDYIGARWPQFDDGHDVGNGGFSLRSRRLMETCRQLEFQGSHPEDVMICRRNRTWLEQQGICFAPSHLADDFSTERTGELTNSFGYHGVFNMPQAIGIEAFWKLYCELDDRRTIWQDFRSIFREVGRGPAGSRRAALMLLDRLV